MKANLTPWYLAGAGFWALRLAAHGSCDFMRDNRKEDLRIGFEAPDLTMGLAAALLAANLFTKPGEEEARQRGREGLAREKD